MTQFINEYQFEWTQLPRAHDISRVIIKLITFLQKYHQFFHKSYGLINGHKKWTLIKINIKNKENEQKLIKIYVLNFEMSGKILNKWFLINKLVHC